MPGYKNGYAIALTASLLFLSLQAVAATGNKVITYPAPAGEKLSADYTITVNGRPVDAYPAKTQWHDGKYSFAYFDFSGKITVRIQSLLPLDHLEILPAKYGIKPRVEKGILTFETDKPFNISIEPEGQNSPLLLFGNPLEKEPPAKNDPGLIYYGPGIYKPGIITLHTGQTLYIAGGAIVKAAIKAEGNNIRIRGRGILDGSDWGHGAGPLGRMVNFINCRNASLQGIIIRGSYNWTVVPQASDSVTISNIKLCGSRVGNDDGIDPVNCSNVLITDCFLRTDDDCIAIKGLGLDNNKADENIKIEHCTFWTDYANVFRIGFESQETVMKNIAVNDIDVIHFMGDRNIKEYWNKCVVYMQPMDDLPMENFRFENIRIHGEGQENLFKLMPMKFSWEGRERDIPGRCIKNVLFKDITVYGKTNGKLGAIYIAGADKNHPVEGVVFENVIRYGNLLTDNSPEFETGPFAYHIRCITTRPGLKTNEIDVSKSGNDHGSGTPGSPFLTIQKAVGSAKPGDLIVVHKGTYAESVQFSKGGISEYKRVTLRAAPGEDVTIRGSVTGNMSQANYIWIDGFTMAPPAGGTAGKDHPLISLNGGHHWVIENCILTGAPETAIRIGGITAGRESHRNTGHHIIRDNVIQNCGQSAIAGGINASGSEIYGNLVEDINGKEKYDTSDIAGIILKHAMNAYIHDNFIRRIKGKEAAYGIALLSDSRNARISCNVIAATDKSGIYLARNLGPVLIDQNVFVEPGPAIKKDIWETRSAGNIFVHNLFYNCEIAWGTPISNSRNAAGVANEGWYNNVFIKGGLGNMPLNREILSDYNLFVAGARKSALDINSTADAFNPSFTCRSNADSIIISYNWNGSFFKGNGPFINTAFLRKFSASRQRTEDPRDSSTNIDLDYFGNNKGRGRQKPGPFNGWTIKHGENTFLLFALQQH